MKFFASVLFVVVITTKPTLLVAKGDTVKITIESAGLPSPIEITDSKVRQFNIWSGPGTYLDGVEARQGFIIDWAKPLDASPAGLHHYKVSFYEGCEQSISCRTSEPSLAYVVYYAHNPSTGDGFVYLPGRGSEFAQLNTSHIYRGQGYEGRWFWAAKVWNDFVRPIIANAKVAR